MPVYRDILRNAPFIPSWFAFRTELRANPRIKPLIKESGAAPRTIQYLAEEAPITYPVPVTPPGITKEKEREDVLAAREDLIRTVHATISADFGTTSEAIKALEKRANYATDDVYKIPPAENDVLVTIGSSLTAWVDRARGTTPPRTPSDAEKADETINIVQAIRSQLGKPDLSGLSDAKIVQALVTTQVPNANPCPTLFKIFDDPAKQADLARTLGITLPAARDSLLQATADYFTRAGTAGRIAARDAIVAIADAGDRAKVTEELDILPNQWKLYKLLDPPERKGRLEQLLGATPGEITPENLIEKISTFLSTKPQAAQKLRHLSQGKDPETGATITPAVTTFTDPEFEALIQELAHLQEVRTGAVPRLQLADLYIVPDGKNIFTDPDYITLRGTITDPGYVAAIDAAETLIKAERYYRPAPPTTNPFLVKFGRESETFAVALGIGLVFQILRPIHPATATTEAQYQEFATALAKYSGVKTLSTDDFTPSFYLALLTQSAPHIALLNQMHSWFTSNDNLRDLAAEINDPTITAATIKAANTNSSELFKFLWQHRTNPHVITYLNNNIHPPGTPAAGTLLTSLDGHVTIAAAKQPLSKEARVFSTEVIEARTKNGADLGREPAHAAATKKISDSSKFEKSRDSLIVQHKLYRALDDIYERDIAAVINKYAAPDGETAWAARKRVLEAKRDAAPPTLTPTEAEELNNDPAIRKAIQKFLAAARPPADRDKRNEARYELSRLLTAEAKDMVNFRNELLSFGNGLNHAMLTGSFIAPPTKQQVTLLQKVFGIAILTSARPASTPPDGNAPTASFGTLQYDPLTGMWLQKETTRFISTEIVEVDVIDATGRPTGAKRREERKVESTKTTNFFANPKCLYLSSEGKGEDMEVEEAIPGGGVRKVKRHVIAPSQMEIAAYVRMSYLINNFGFYEKDKDGKFIIPTHPLADAQMFKDAFDERLNPDELNLAKPLAILTLFTVVVLMKTVGLLAFMTIYALVAAIINLISYVLNIPARLLGAGAESQLGYLNLTPAGAPTLQEWRMDMRGEVSWLFSALFSKDALFLNNKEMFINRLEQVAFDHWLQGKMEVLGFCVMSDEAKKFDQDMSNDRVGKRAYDGLRKRAEKAFNFRKAELLKDERYFSDISTMDPASDEYKAYDRLASAIALKEAAIASKAPFEEDKINQLVFLCEGDIAKAKGLAAGRAAVFAGAAGAPGALGAPAAGGAGPAAVFLGGALPSGAPPAVALHAAAASGGTGGTTGAPSTGVRVSASPGTPATTAALVSGALEFARTLALSVKLGGASPKQAAEAAVQILLERGFYLQEGDANNKAMRAVSRAIQGVALGEEPATAAKAGANAFDGTPEQITQVQALLEELEVVQPAAAARVFMAPGGGSS